MYHSFVFTLYFIPMEVIRPQFNFLSLVRSFEIKSINVYPQIGFLTISFFPEKLNIQDAASGNRLV